ncbi:MAG: hypothetical protein KBA03_03130 [Anaerolineaceae bacterium]|jgi:hypothetical protein|nr:hypothetical protein [Anaerolineaceae bacterium]
MISYTKFWLQVLSVIIGSFLLLAAHTWFGGLYGGLLISIFAFFLIIYLIDKQHLIGLFMRFSLQDLKYLLPIAIEFVLVSVIIFIYAKSANIPVNINATWQDFLGLLARQSLLIIREELSTSFLWLIAAFQILQIFGKLDGSPKQMRSISLILAILFGLGHIERVWQVWPMQIEVSYFWLWAVSYIYSSFCLGYYFKTMMFKTFNFPLTVIAHLLINIARSMNDFYKGFSPFFMFLTAILIPTMYLIYAIVKLNKLPENPRLQSLIEGLKPKTIEE